MKIGAVQVCCLLNAKPNAHDSFWIGVCWESSSREVTVGMVSRVLKYGFSEGPDLFPMSGKY